jgi:hypothetical protein
MGAGHGAGLRPSTLSTCRIALSSPSLCARDNRPAQLTIGARFGRALIGQTGPKFTLQSDDLSPEAVTLGLELDDALTKLPVLDERLGCIRGVEESGHSLALTGSVGAHPLGVGRPLLRPPRSPLQVVHATTLKQ